MKIKVCGMREPANIAAVAALLPDYMGFIFYPGSKRFAGALDPQVVKELPGTIIKTGVFVDATYGEILARVQEYGLQAVQLHGNEPVSLCEKLKAESLKVIRAFGVDESFDFTKIEPFIPVVSYFLFDTKTPEHGGSGRSFNWNLLSNYPYTVPFFLSGGIGPENSAVLANIRDHRLYAADLNSRFEIAPGVKDTEKLTIVFEQLKNARITAGLEDK